MTDPNAIRSNPFLPTPPNPGPARQGGEGGDRGGTETDRPVMPTLRKITVATPAGTTLAIRVQSPSPPAAFAKAGTTAGSKGKPGGKEKLTGGRWITIGGKDGGGFRRLYVKGKGKGAKVLAGGGATPGHPKTIAEAAGGGGAGKPPAPASPTSGKPKEAGGKAAVKAAPAAKAKGSAKAEKPDKLTSAKPASTKSGRDFAGKPAKDVEDYHGSMSKDWSAKLSPTHKDALSTYSGADFISTNTTLRSGKLAEANMGRKKQVDALDESLSRSGISESVTVYRGVGSLKSIGIDPANVKVGTSVADKAYLSTSLTPDIARKFAGDGGAVLRINAKAGAKGASLAGATWLAHEREVLFARNSRLTVTGVSRDSGGRLVLDMDIDHD